MDGDTVQDVEVTMTELVATGISEAVLAQLEAQGLPLKRSMKIELPDFPEDITLVDDNELMIMASKYMENMNFLRTQVACAAIAEAESENTLDDAIAQGLLSKTTGKTTEKAALLRASVLTDPVIKELADAKNYSHAYRKLLDTLLENTERYYSLTSRELTRRTSTGRSSFNRYAP